MSRKLGSKKILKAFAFLVNAEQNQSVFTFADLVAGSGWAESTARGNLGKKLSQLVQQVDGGYEAVGVKLLTADAFCRICSQSAALSRDPLRPTLTPRAEGLVIKAREAALAAAGFPREDRPYRPHITIARCRPASGVGDWPVPSERLFPFWATARFVLMQTLPPDVRAKDGKPRYNTVQAFPFGDAQS